MHGLYRHVRGLTYTVPCCCPSTTGGAGAYDEDEWEHSIETYHEDPEYSKRSVPITFPNIIIQSMDMRMYVLRPSLHIGVSQLKLQHICFRAAG